MPTLKKWKRNIINKSLYYPSIELLLKNEGALLIVFHFYGMGSYDKKE